MTTIVHKPSEVMEMLDLKESTFKKYYLELEKEGYTFQKDGRMRLFTDDDIKVLEAFMELIKYDGITIPLAAKKVVEMSGKKAITSQPESYDVMTLVNNAVSAALEIHNKEISQLRNEIQLLREQQVKDRDELVMTTLNEIRESNKQLLEVKQMIASSKEEPKKKWWKFWH